jgi:hypothetical protein
MVAEAFMKVPPKLTSSFFVVVGVLWALAHDLRRLGSGYRNENKASG